MNIKKSIKSLINRSYYLRKTLSSLHVCLIKMRNKDNKFIIGKSSVKIQKEIRGSHNLVKIGNNCYVDKLRVLIHGDYNHIVIEDNCHIGPDCSLWIEGAHSNILIGGGLQ